jgi:hypothetical protein
MSVAKQFTKFAEKELPQHLKEIELLKPRSDDELLEFQVMGCCEPSHFFTEIHKFKDQSISKRKFQQMMDISQRPSISEEVFGQLYKKFKQEGREEEVEGSLEFQYDPIGPWVEIQNFEEQMKIHKFKETIKKDKLAQIMQQVFIGVVPLLLLQFLGEFADIFPLTMKVPQVEPIQVILAIVLLHILQEFLEVKVLLEFARSELLRIRASCTTGNLVQLLMRSEAKLNFIERRSMKFYARSNDFYRILSEEFLDVPWRSQPAATEKFGSLVAEYIEGKINRGLKIDEVTDDEKIKFKKTLKELLLDASRSWKEAARPDLEKFFAKTEGAIEQIATDFSWFSANELIWKN